MIYILICLSLSLAGITGLQFFYLAYLDRLDRDQKNLIRELEKHCQHLSHKLELAESANNNEVSRSGFSGEDDNEIWADVLEEA